jgi:hypothetical protein
LTFESLISLAAAAHTAGEVIETPGHPPTTETMYEYFWACAATAKEPVMVMAIANERTCEEVEGARTMGLGIS